MFAFVIGNGKSRSGFDLNILKTVEDSIIFGTNALYREFIPDYLVAIDEGIISEIKQSDFPKENLLIPPLDERWEPAECNPNRPRSNAGMNAMREAIKRGSKIIIGLGFDFLIQDKDASVSNLYDGTQNYGPETRASYHDNFGRMNYLEWLARTNPDVKFIFVYPENTLIQSLNQSNIYKISYNQLFE